VIGQNIIGDISIQFLGGHFHPVTTSASASIAIIAKFIYNYYLISGIISIIIQIGGFIMIEDIYAFCTIAKYESFSKAARELGLSPPVITRRLSRLEETLATRLLNRTTRKVTLTEAGALFYNEVNDILHALEASKESIKSLTTQVSGTLKVGIPASLSRYYVIPEMKNFLEKYPNLKVQFMSGNHLLNLLHNGYDLVIQCGELPPSSYYFRKIVTMKKVICASKNYLEKFGSPTTLEELSSHNCLHFSFDHMNKTWAVRDKDKIKEIPIDGNIFVDSPSDMKQLAIDGVGIAYLPAYFIHEELKTGKLISILDQFQPIDHSLYAVYPTKKYLAKKTQVFLDFITELLVKVVQDRENRIGKTDAYING